MNNSGQRNDFDVVAERGQRKTRISVESKIVRWNTEIPEDGDGNPAELILHTRGGFFLIPISKRDTGDRKLCSLTAQAPKTISTRPFNLIEEMSLDIFAHAVEPWNPVYTWAARPRISVGSDESGFYSGSARSLTGFDVDSNVGDHDEGPNDENEENQARTKLEDAASPPRIVPAKRKHGEEERLTPQSIEAIPVSTSVTVEQGAFEGA